MMFRQATGAKPVDEEWHEKRETARRTTFSLAEWSQEEITRWDLDTADITGRDNPRTYRVDRPVDGPGQVKNGTDVRTLDNR